MQGVQVPFLAGELRSHMPHGQKNQNTKQKQYCNKFNKDFKDGPHTHTNLKKKKVAQTYLDFQGCLLFQTALKNSVPPAFPPQLSHCKTVKMLIKVRFMFMVSWVCLEWS